MNKDGTGSIATVIGIEKELYQTLKQMDSDPFSGKDTKEYTYDGTTYVSYSEVKEYGSYEDMENALLEMTYDEVLEIAQQLDTESDDDDTTYSDYEGALVPESNNNIFSSVNIEKNGGIFYASYTFNAVMNSRSNTEMDEETAEAIRIIITVEMPTEITQYKGGKVEENKITFDVTDISDSQEFAATCEHNNTGVVIGIVIGLVLLVAGFVFLVKFKK
jgi:hypothetical protein